MRPVLALSIALLACAARPAAPEPSPWPALANDAEIDAALPRLTNWGRWGPADRRGTLNLIVPEAVRAAAALVRARSASTDRRFSSGSRIATSDTWLSSSTRDTGRPP